MTSTTCSKWAFNLALAASLVFLAGAADKAHSKSGNKDGPMKFKGLDRNNDGRISRDEWRGSDQSFDVHDKNRDGVIGGAEVGEALQESGYDDFVEIDRNNDGRISRTEWRWEHADFVRMDVTRDGSLSRSEYFGTAGTGIDSYPPAPHRPDTTGPTVPAIPSRPAMEDAQGRFTRLDRDGNGRLSRSEWDGDAKTFNQLDDNENGVLSREEVLETAPAARKALFKRLDTNGNGTIARKEWTGDKQSFSRLDVNNDDKLMQAEFLKQYHDLELSFFGMDKDDDRKLSRQEWRGDKGAFTNLDDNKDGQVSFVEFVGVI